MALKGNKKKPATPKKKGGKKAKAPSTPEPFPGVTNGWHAQEVRDMREDFIRWAKGFSVRQGLTPKQFTTMMTELGKQIGGVK